MGRGKTGGECGMSFTVGWCGGGGQFTNDGTCLEAWVTSSFECVEALLCI
jgi:hypothetical protein